MRKHPQGRLGLLQLIKFFMSDLWKKYYFKDFITQDHLNKI